LRDHLRCPVPCRLLLSPCDHSARPLFKVSHLNLHAFVGGQEMPFAVIPAKAGIQPSYGFKKNLDPVFQRGDDLLRSHHFRLSLALMSITHINTQQNPIANRQDFLILPP